MTSSPPSAAGISMLGAEMLTWSDLDGDRGPVTGRVLEHLTTGSGNDGGRVLVLGPTGASLAATVTGRFGAADVHTRSFPDAETLRGLLGDHAVVLCGALRRLPVPPGGYTAVVALDGLNRVESAEEPARPWAEILTQLIGLLADEGELFLTVANPAGVDQLLRLDAVSATSDASWPTWGSEQVGPVTLREAVSVLDGQSGGSTYAWALHGDVLNPSAAVPTAVLSGRPGDRVLRRAITAAYAGPAGRTTVLGDVPSTAGRLFEAELAVATAPAWLLHTRRGPALGDEGDRFLVLDHDADVGARVSSHVWSDDGWHRELVGHAGVDGSDGPLPEGPTLDEQLTARLQAHDATGAGEVVRSMAADLDALLAGDASRDTVLLHALLRHAHEHLAHGRRHPWPAGTTPRRAATLLAAAAGVEPDEDAWTQVARLDTARDLDTTGRGIVLPASYAELREVADELAARVAEQDAYVVWLIDAVQKRQRRLRHTRGVLRELRESREHRLARKLHLLARLRRRLRRGSTVEPRIGIWFESEPDPDDDGQVHVEAHLLPPGYQPHPGVTVHAPGEDPLAHRVTE